MKIHGVGINDSKTPVSKRIPGGEVKCAFYEKWRGMLRRCYSASFQLKNQTYAGCTVCNEWLTFSNFKAWMEQQDWKGKELDKDLLVTGNKLYSPDRCLFINKISNLFTSDDSSRKGLLMFGVTKRGKSEKYYARCNNPITKKLEHVGAFDSEISAHMAWRKRKHEIACQLADLESNDVAEKLLRSKYL